MRLAVVSLMALCAVAGTAIAQPPPSALQPERSPSRAPAPKPKKLSPEAIEAIRDACDRQQPACDPIALLGSYEQIALQRALDAGHLTIDHAPWGKTLRAIIVDPQDVFDDHDGPFQLLNIFHRTTRRTAIDREVLLRPGDVWKQSAVDETVRKLHDPTQLVVAVAVPVETGEAGTVDLLMVTRDVWSIRLNSDYEIQSGKFTYLTLSLSENNFLGWRKLVAIVFTMDQGAYEFGPRYIDHNLFGDHLWLTGRGGAIFNRGTSKYEGTESSIELAQPLWSLDSEWGASVSWAHRFDVARSFRGTTLRTYDAPETPGDDMVPWQYREKIFSLTTSIVHQWPGAVEQQLRFGHILGLQRPSLLDDNTPVDPVVRDAFVHDVLPRSERSSQLFASYTLFTPRYRAFHNIERFDLAEDAQLGPSLTLTGGVAFHLIGSENNFLRVATSAGWAEPLGDGLWSVGATSEHRYDEGGWIDNLFTLNARLVTPSFAIGRVVFDGDLSTRWDETQNRFLSAGGDSGLRGFIIGEFTGQRRAVGHVELRTSPMKVWFMRGGATAFWDVGGAANSFGDMAVHDDVGVGLRVVVPQTSPEPIRVDWAFGLDGDHAGWPGRIIAGYRQGF